MWCFAKKYDSDVRLDGKTAVITGGNCGIGKETAADLYKRGARVYILCRDQSKAEVVIKEFQTEIEKTSATQEIIYKNLDLGDLSSVRKCAKELLEEEQHIHLLINNAGVMTSPILRTKDGFEMHFGTNHLGHFLLTLLLLPKIIQSGSARIINVSSIIQGMPYYGGKLNLDDLNYVKRKKYTQLNAYSQSKLANVLFTKELARKLKDSGIDNVTTYSLHPGIIATELGRNFDTILWSYSWLWKTFKNYFLLSPKQGAATTLYCALDKDLAKQSGLYYSNCAENNPHSLALNEENAKKLWDISTVMVKLEDYNPFQMY